ncbi:hypothetical protein ACOMHN_035541 [Nucella lapillus]
MVTFLLMMLTSQMTSGCQCPSCHYVDSAQNCQCCVYRQLGKRSDPATSNYDHFAPILQTLARLSAAGAFPAHFASGAAPPLPINLKRFTSSDGKFSTAKMYRGWNYGITYGGRKREESRKGDGVRRGSGGLVDALNNLKLASVLDNTPAISGGASNNQQYDYEGN